MPWPAPRSPRTLLRALLGVGLLVAALDAGRLALDEAGSGICAARPLGSPPSASALEQRALGARQIGRVELAAAWARAAVATAPRRSSLRLLHGGLLEESGDEESASGEAEAAFAADPMRAPVARRSALAAVRRFRKGGDPDDLEKAVGRMWIANLSEPWRAGEGVLLLRASGADPVRLRASVPEHPEARLSAGQAFLELGMPGAAAVELALARDCGKPAKRDRLLGKARLLLGDPDGAFLAYRDATRAAGPELLRGIPEDAGEAGDPKAGIALLDRLGEEERLPLATLLASRLCLRSGDPAGAARRIVASPRLRDDPEALALLAEARAEAARP
ncbi:MAG: hypothetical protein L0323_15740 [Planctomycetes bacterium]|nr:hypothetical protein [Planctomycetota bacterium]